MPSRSDKTSWVSGSATFPNGRGLIVATILSLLTIGAAFAGGAIFIVRSSDNAENEAVVRCRSMVESERRASDARYAPAGAVERIAAKVDAISEGITEIKGDVRALRVETREALTGRRGRR